MKNITREEYETAYCIVKKYQEQVTKEANKVKWEVRYVDEHHVDPDTKIEDLDISIRLLNCIKRFPALLNEPGETLRDIHALSPHWEFCKGFGRKSKTELQLQFKYANLL